MGKRKNIVGFSVFVLVVFVAGFFLGRVSSGYFPFTSHDRNQEKLLSQSINKSFQFPVKDAQGTTITDIKYTITTASAQSNVLINGQKAFPVKGKIFLIIAIRLTNTFDQNIQINSRDYIRLQENNSPEFLAPDFHNDPVEVDAISTKLTRIGFAVNQNDRNIKLLVGEIDQPKTTIPMTVFTSHLPTKK